MRFLISLFMPILFLIGQTASAADISTLAECTVKVFSEINRTHKWSGKAPAGCPAGVVVEQRQDGAFTSAWVTEGGRGGWARTVFTAAMGYAEIADKNDVVKVGKEIRSRAGRLGRCLDSLIAVKDPLECRYHADKSYLVGDETGIRHEWLIWLDDNGRHTVIEYSFGNTELTPTPPADLPGGQPLLFNMIPDIHTKGGKKGRSGSSAGSMNKALGKI
jgi:hypothetical protein